MRQSPNIESAESARCVNDVLNAALTNERRKLAGAGWELGDATGFLGLSPEEEAYIELRHETGRRPEGAAVA